MTVSKRHLTYLLLVLIVLIGGWLRMNGIFADSFAYTYDVGRDLLQVREIVVNHNLTLIGQTTGLAGLFYGPWWYYFLTIPYILFNGNPQGVAFFIALLGLATVVLGFLLGKKIRDTRLGLLLAALLSFSPYMIGLTSQIWNPNIAPFFIFVVLLLLYPVLIDRKLSAFSAGILGLLTGFLLDAEIVFGLLFVAGVVMSSVFVLRKRVFQKSSLFFLLGFFATLTPRILFEFRHDFLMTRNFFQSSGAEQGALFALPTLSVVTDRIVFFFDMFDRTFFDKHFLLSGVLLFILSATYISSTKKLSETEKVYIQLIFGVSMTFFIGFLFFSHNLFNHYAVGLPILFIVLAAVLFYRSIHLLSSRLLQNSLLVLFLIIILNPFTIISALQNPDWEGDAAVYRNQVAVIDYIYRYADERPFNYVAYTPAVHDYTYRYLFLWHGQRAYGYTPATSKETLFFLILEPDHQYPERVTHWLSQREGDGEVVDEQVVKGGIRVQIRNH